MKARRLAQSSRVLETPSNEDGSDGSNLRFIDLFCGIGGFRIAFEHLGGRCVFSSDYNKFSQQTYEANFGERPHGDIPTIAVADIPTHDILCAGFPCQPFSIAGVPKNSELRKDIKRRATRLSINRRNTALAEKIRCRIKQG